MSKQMWIGISSLRSFAVFAVLVCLASCKDGIIEYKGVRLEVQSRELPNGIRVYLLPNSEAKTISYQTWLMIGSRNERPGESGHAHLFEHLLFKGTEAFPRGKGPTMVNWIESMGGTTDVVASRDYVYSATDIQPEGLKRVIEWDADRWQALSKLEAGTELVEFEKRLLFEERQMKIESVPTSLMQESLWQLAFEDHPYGKSLYGSSEDLFVMNKDSIERFVRSSVVGRNLVVIITGNISGSSIEVSSGSSTENSIFEYIRKNYSSIPKKADCKQPSCTVFSPEEESIQNEERRLLLSDAYTEKGGIGRRLSVGYKVTSAREADTHALDVMTGIIFDGMNSRANQQLVKNEKLLESISGISYTPKDRGLLLIQAECAKNVVPKTVEERLDVLFKEVKDKGVTDVEVERAKNQLIVSFLNQMQTPRGLGLFLGVVTSVLGKPEDFIRDLERYDRVTKEDVQRVAKTYLIPERRSVVILDSKRGSL